MPPRLFLFLGLAAFVVIFESCSDISAKSETTPAQTQPTPQPARVAAVKAEIVTIGQDLELTGEFRPWQQAELQARVPGYLKSLTVDAGSTVRAGQLVGVIETPELEAELGEATAAILKAKSEEARMAAGIQLAESKLDVAKASFRRLTSVNQKEPGLIAAQEIDESIARARSAEADLTSAKANRDAGRQQTVSAEARAQRAASMLNFSRLTAPFSGVVTKRYVDPGNMIQVAPIIRICNIDMLRLAIVLPENGVAQVRVGTPVLIRVPALELHLEGRVARLTQQLSSNSRSMEAEVDVPNPGHKIAAGMIAEIGVHGRSAREAMGLPVQAVVRRGGQTYVLAVRADNTLEDRRIQIGLETATHVELLSGLAKDERVVIGNRSLLKAGQKVEVKDGASL